MGQNILLLTAPTEHTEKTSKALEQIGLNIYRYEKTEDLRAGLSIYSPAFLLLDFDIKGVDSLLVKLAFEQRIPQPYIIIAAVYADGNDRAAMLKRGADHCVDKPIIVHEVLAVIDSVLRRRKQTHTIKHKGIIINKSCRVVTMYGEPVLLTRKEYQVLCFLADHAGIILTKEEIYRAVWKSN